MVRVVVLCLTGIVLSLAGFMFSFSMDLDFWGEWIPAHLYANCVSLGFSLSAVLLNSYKWKTAEIVIQKKNAIICFGVVFVLASVGGYVFGWFVYLSPIFFGALFALSLYCIMFFSFRVFAPRGRSGNVDVRFWQITSVLLALAIVILTICFWLPFLDWLTS